MKKLIWGLFFVGGAYLSNRIAGVYWMIAFIGLWLASGFIFKKLHIGDALRLIGFVVFFMAMMLGGGVILARTWGETAAGVWIFICVVLLMIFQKRIVRMIPIFRIAQEFEDIVKEKSKQR
jgi:hypothetical protein